MSDLYERDFFAWINEQVALLRDGNLALADVRNITEEIATLGRNETRELENRLAVLLHRLLKWRFQTGLRSGSFALSLKVAREAVADFLAESPSLRLALPGAMLTAYRRARREMAMETGFDLDTFPATSPWSFDQAMQDPL